jgi:predicted metalloprotease
MRWEDLPSSGNVEDRRSGGGFGGGIPGGAGGLGIGGMMVLGLIGWALGIDPSILIGGAEMLNRGGGSSYQQPSTTGPTGAPTDQVGRFVDKVLGSADQQWKEIFQQAGGRYRPPKLVMFREATQSGCGFAQSAMGPFYCPTDQKIYLDTSFFKQIEQRFRGCSGKACQFAQAYVIAHEVGHHVQNQLGILTKVQQLKQSVGNRAQANQLQVRTELQADCFAGVWAKHSDQKWNLLEPGDVEAALQTASAIGDDTLQRQAQGRVVPDSFTHGSAEQRQRWFSRGLKDGTVQSCNTFQATQL